MEPPPTSLPPNQRLGGYELVQWLATGGMAEVYVARRIGAYGFTKIVALKRILPQFVRDAGFVSMFIDEARVCSRLSHPNIVEVIDFGEHEGDLFMAMELVDGTTCARLVRAAASRGETVPVEDSLYITLSVVRALEYAHTLADEEGRPLNLVHRDVSPGNVMIARSGVVKLGDFGIVRATGLDRHTQQGQLKGKLGYMSPEQVLGRELDARSDLFTLGIVLAELLVGKPIFSHGAELDILMRIRDADAGVFTRNAQNVPEELRAIVYRLLSRDPAQRPQSAAELGAAIEAFVRQRGLHLAPNRLAAYLEYLGIAKTSGRSDMARPAVQVDTQKGAPTRPAKSPPEAPTSGPATYRVQLGDGSFSAAMPLTQVLELIVSGQASSDAPVSRDGGAFVPARDHPELRRAATSSAHRWEITGITSALRPVAVPRAGVAGVLAGLAARRVTGMLLCEQGARKKKVYLARGRVEYASSTDREELLGRQLLKRGKVLPVELDMALAVAPKYGGRLGDALVSLSILRPIELHRAMVEQMQARVVDLLSWDGAHMRLAGGARSHEETLPYPISLLGLVTAGVCTSFGEDELEALLGPHLAGTLTFGLRTAPCPLALGLSELQERLVHHVDERRSAAEVLTIAARTSSVPRVEGLRALFIALSAELLCLPTFVSEGLVVDELCNGQHI